MSQTEKIYEGSMVVVKATMLPEHTEKLKSVTFKFFQDGKVPKNDELCEDSEFEKEFSSSDVGNGDEEDAVEGYDVIVHRVCTPKVPDDQESYVLDYHLFYEIENSSGQIVKNQELSVRQFQVFPRTAQLKATWDKDGKAFHNFKFKVMQNGEQFGDEQHTFSHDTKNVKGETIPAGSAEFNLGLFPGFRIAQISPWEIIEFKESKKRKCEIKGDLKFKAKFLNPKESNIKQLVNYDIENQGQTGIGYEVVVEVGVDENDDTAQEIGTGKKEVHFRVTFGPDTSEKIAKSKRDDSEHPTKVDKVDAADVVTIEEVKAKKEYKGKIELKNGEGRIKLCLGLAGGDTCKVEIAGSEKFIDDKTIEPDRVLTFENWRRVHYELMLPNIMQKEALDTSSNFRADVLRELNTMGRQFFIEFIHDKTHIFNAIESADYGTLGPRRFFDLSGDEQIPAYILSGRNWRNLPKGQSWAKEHPTKTLYISFCDLLLKWRKDTSDEKAGTKDFSSTLTEATGFMNVEEKFEGFFMPFSGDDAEDGINDVVWTADINKNDDVCKYKPELVIEEERYEDGVSSKLAVVLEADQVLSALPVQIIFKRLPYPELEIEDKSEMKDEEVKDDGKVTIKESTLGKELILEFEILKNEETSEDEDVDDEYYDYDDEDFDDEDEDFDEESFKDNESDESKSVNIISSSSGNDIDFYESVITSDHQNKLSTFFKDLFKEGKNQFSASESANRFNLEIYGNNRTIQQSARIAQLREAIAEAYEQTYQHDGHDFSKELTDEDSKKIQKFVDDILADHQGLVSTQAKAKVFLRCAKGAEHGEDDCFKLVKDKLQELFDKSKKDFSFHPALDTDNELEPKSKTCSLAEITNIEKSTIYEWHFELPIILPDGTAGPGSFISSEKTPEKCPVKFEFSFQPHEISSGEADGKLLAWVCSNSDSSKQLLRLILQSFNASGDKANLKHGHGEKGNPGDCLEDKIALCDKCVEFGRSTNLTSI